MFLCKIKIIFKEKDSRELYSYSNLYNFCNEMIAWTGIVDFTRVETNKGNSVNQGYSRPVSKLRGPSKGRKKVRGQCWKEKWAKKLITVFGLAKFLSDLCCQFRRVRQPS